MVISRLRLGTLGTLRAPLVVAVTLALVAVAVPYPDAAVEANGTGLTSTTTTVTSDVNPSVTGQTVTFTATVAGPITSYTGPGIDRPTGIAVGPDGALWFGNYGTNSIGRITTDGVVTNYTDAGISRPYTIAAGPPADGTLWFTSRDNNKIGRITTAGAINLYSDATKIAGPYGIALGSDNALWYANGGIGGQYITKRSIGRITTAGAVSYFTATPPGDPWSCPGLTDPICEPTGIAAGPDGALWFTNWGTHSIGRITTGGALSIYTGTGVSGPLYITAGPDGAMWFTNAGNDSIGRIDVTTYAITNYASGTISGPRFITTGPDGNLWFTNAIGDSIGRITPAGVVTSYTAASVDGPDGIVSGPDGAIWFTNYDGDSIGRISPAAPGGGTPTGSVQFNIDGTNVGLPVPLVAGQAQLPVSTLPPFFHTVGATYSGDSNFMPSFSTNYAQAVALTANLPAGGTLTTGLEATPDFPFALALTTPNAGTVTIGIQPVTGTAPSGFSYLGYELVITAPAATAANPLVLVFQIDASLLAGQNVSDIVVNRNGTAIPNCTAADATPDPCISSRVLLPSGDAQITGRTSAVSTWTFATPNITTTAVTSNQNPSVYGRPVTFTATVSEVIADSVSPTGTVEFKDGGTTIAGCGAAPLNGSGQASCGPLTDLSVGIHTISAAYSGDTNFSASTSPNLTQTVTPASSTADTTAPYTGYVEVGLLAGGQVSSGPLLVSWSASDNVTPAADLVHQVQVRRLVHGVWSHWADVATVTGTMLETVRPLWRHFQYRVQTRDQAGNWGAWEESDPMVLIRRDDRHFRKGSGWTRLPMAGAMGRHVAQSSIIGSWARLRFWGSGVALVMPTGAGLGSIEVCVDAGTATQQCQNVDLSTFTPSGQRRLVAVFNGLAYGLHHLRVRVTGGTVDLDGALISR